MGLPIHNPNVNQKLDAVNVSYDIWKEYFDPNNYAGKRHWNSHVYATSKLLNHDHGWSESSQSVDYKSATGFMRMGWDLLFCLELYRQLRMKGDTVKEAEVGNPFRIWLNQYVDWIIAYKPTGWANGSNHPWAGIALNLISQCYEHVAGFDATIKAKIKNTADELAYAIVLHEHTLYDGNYHLYKNGTASYVPKTTVAIGGVPRLQNYQRGVDVATGQEVDTDIQSIPHRHNGFCLLMGGLGKYAYHVYRYTNSNPASFIYRTELLRMAIYAASIVPTNGATAQGGTMAGDEATYDYPFNGKSVRFHGAANLDTIHYNTYSMLGMEWAGHGIDYSPQHLRPASSAVSAAERMANRWNTITADLVTKGNPNPFPNATFTTKQDASAWVDVNDAYRRDLTDGEYDHHIDDANVPYMYGSISYLGKNFQTMFDRIFKNQGIVAQLAVDHNGVDTPRTKVKYPLNTYYFNEQVIYTFDSSKGEGTDTLANRNNAVWGKSKETAFHRTLMGMTGAMEKGLTIYG